jgi:hypothetical protein
MLFTRDIPGGITMSRLLTVTLALVGGIAGCASAPPTKHMEASTAAIRAAEEVGAARVPAATLHLQLAKEQAQHAQKLMKDGRNEEATFVLMRAEADADVAVALARADQEQQRANEAQLKVQQLKSDLK